MFHFPSFEGLRYGFRPAWLSILRGEWDDAFWKSAQLVLWIAGCAAFITTEYKIISHLAVYIGPERYGDEPRALSASVSIAGLGLRCRC